MSEATMSVGSSGAEGATGAAAPSPVGSEKADASTKVGAQGSAAPEDPEFEFEVETEEKDPSDPAKTVKKTAKQKMKMSEAKQKLGRFSHFENETNRTKATTERFYNERVKPLEDLVEQMKKDPTLLHKFAQHIGVDFDKAALEHAKREVELAKMTPEQRELHATKAELARIKAEQTANKERAEQQQLSHQMRQEVTRIQTEVAAAATAANLPRDPATLQMMTAHMRAALNEGKAPDAKAAAEHVKNALEGSYAARIEGLTYEQVKTKYPKLLTMIREGDILEMKGSAGRGDSSSSPRPRQTRQPQPREIISPEEYQRRLERGE